MAKNLLSNFLILFFYIFLNRIKISNLYSLIEYRTQVIIMLRFFFVKRLRFQFDWRDISYLRFWRLWIFFLRKGNGFVNAVLSMFIYRLNLKSKWFPCTAWSCSAASFSLCWHWWWFYGWFPWRSHSWWCWCSAQIPSISNKIKFIRKYSERIRFPNKHKVAAAVCVFEFEIK